MSVSSDDSNAPVKEMRIGPEFQSTLPSYQTEYDTPSNSTLLWSPPLEHIPDISMVTQEFYEKGYSRQRVLEVIFSNNYDLVTSKSVLMKEGKFGSKIWSKGDKDSFELGMQEFGRKFDLIQSNYLPHKTLPNLVEYYNEWRRNEPVSKVDLKLECYGENLHCDTSALSEVDRSLNHDGVNDNISVDVEELKIVMMDKDGEETERLESECQHNKLAIQVNSYSIRMLKSSRCYEEIEKMRPRSFHTSKLKQLKKSRKRVNSLDIPDMVSNGSVSAKRVKCIDDIDTNNNSSVL